MNHQIFIGDVFHKRFIPKEHSFRYPLFYLKLNLQKLRRTNSLIFNYNQFALFSFYDKDHGFRDGTDLKNFAYYQLEKNNIKASIEYIKLHTFPRILGYVFNPISIWYLYDADDTLIATIAEVNNTFGGTHSYVLTNQNIHHKKILHVSPFNKIIGDYEFNFKTDVDKHETIAIKYRVNSKNVLFASISGSPWDFNNKNILKCFFKFPLLTIVNVIRIHWHAIKLYFKKVPFYGTNGAVHDS